MHMTEERNPAAMPTPGLGALFAGFLGIGIIGFGGVLPWARRMVVEQRRWLSPSEFTDLLALCQFLPGPNIVNMAVALGARYRGAAGSLAAVGGLLAAPMAIVVALGGVYGRYGQVPMVAHALGGLAASASGLVVAMAVRIAAPVRRHWAGVVVAVVAFIAIALIRTPLLPTMLVLAPVSVLFCRRFPA
jgi:chromate transporter